MHKVNLDAQQLVSYAMLDDEEFMNKISIFKIAKAIFFHI